jgi:hypothetical protein
MSNPAAGAKYVAALVVGVVGAGAFAGVSHDGRGAAPPEEPEPIVEAPLPSTTVGATSATSSTTRTASAPTSAHVEATQGTQPAQPAAPDPVPTRARLRSRGS